MSYDLAKVTVIRALSLPPRTRFEYAGAVYEVLREYHDAVSACFNAIKLPLTKDSPNFEYRWSFSVYWKELNRGRIQLRRDESAGL